MIYFQIIFSWIVELVKRIPAMFYLVVLTSALIALLVVVISNIYPTTKDYMSNYIAQGLEINTYTNDVKCYGREKAIRDLDQFKIFKGGTYTVYSVGNQMNIDDGDTQFYLGYCDILKKETK